MKKKLLFRRVKGKILPLLPRRVSAQTGVRIEGGVCAPRGFRVAGVSCGIKKKGENDLALLISENPCCAAGTFTTNRIKAAPVLWDIQNIHRPIRGVVVNSGNANACTGKAGFQDAKKMARLVSEEVGDQGYSRERENFLVCSTGRIGVPLPMGKIALGIQKAARQFSSDDQAAVEAIMTTDTFPKRIAVKIPMGGKIARMGGMAKGAGMIQPGMNAMGKGGPLHATMLCFLTTDVSMGRSLLQECLNQAVAQSFNRITVDGDMSTNDTVLLLANGLAEIPRIKKGSAEHQSFQLALNRVTLALAQMIARDGEGISKVVTVEITGAASPMDAEKAVRAVANSKLVKCSWCGEDANWGRICDAIGYSGAYCDFSRISIGYNGIPLIHRGLQIIKNLLKVRQALKKHNFSVQCDLGLGKHRAILYTTDLTEKYVKLNLGE